MTKVKKLGDTYICKNYDIFVEDDFTVHDWRDGFAYFDTNSLGEAFRKISELTGNKVVLKG